MRMLDGMNKSSTETKLDTYFEDNKSKNRRKFSEVIYKIPFTNENMLSNSSKVTEANLATTAIAIGRKRKSSTISNLSNLDFHGSGLHMHAVTIATFKSVLSY